MELSMCLSSFVKISPRSPLGAKRVFVGCGECEECRAVAKSSWCFRLRAEIENKVNQGYYVVFFTLTYSDDALPRLTSECFREDVEIKPEWENIPCFSRDDIEKFVHSVREWLWREYDYKQVSYFIAGEYGSNTKRPHYHGIMCLPSSVDASRFHDFILSQWTPLGHVFPRFPAGGVDSHGYEHKPFVVRSPASAARYAAKYACKDLYYDEFLSSVGLSDIQLDLKSRAFKRSRCFHVQSRSLGACLLDGLSDLDKLDLIRIGHAFAGDTEFSKIPIYIRNKLIFDNKYIYEKRPMTGDRVLGDVTTRTDCLYKRLVSREANAFFKLYAKEIFDAKVLSYTQLLCDMTDPKNYEARHVPASVAASAVLALNKVQDLGVSFNMASTLYLLYDGVDESKRVYPDRDACWMVWLARYCDVDLSMWPCGYHSPLLDIVLVCVEYAISCYYYNPLRKSEMQRLTDKIRDFFGHLE